MRLKISRVDQAQTKTPAEQGVREGRPWRPSVYFHHSCSISDLAVVFSGLGRPSTSAFATNTMKIITLLFCALMATSLAAHAADDVPPENMIAYAAWARETKDLNLRIKRLEDLLKHYIPLEEGVKITTEYEDGSSIYAVTGSAWVLARAYVEAGQKDKALKVIDWLQENDSKSDLVSKKTKSEQAAPSNGDKPSN
jgi:hypothetical protein